MLSVLKTICIAPFCFCARYPQSRDDGGVSWVFPSCGASVGFLTGYDGELREPLMWRQGSQVSMRVARGSASLHK